MGYLNVPSYVYATASVITTLPWSFKFAFGMVNDCFPIGGYHRKPYMVIGWSICAMMLLLLWATPLPDPYYCADGVSPTLNVTNHQPFLFLGPNPNSGTGVTVCNERAKKQGGQYAVMMMGAAAGYVIADVAADGLTVQFARREPLAVRGQTQTTVYLVRTMGQIVAVAIVGFGMNTKAYGGSFASGISFETAIFLTP